jgi:hypothetical protein
MPGSGTVHIGSYTFEVAPQWVPAYEFNRKPNEVLYGVYYTWDLEGVLVGSNATNTHSNWDDLFTQMADGGVQSVQWKVDGITRAELTESLLDVGPIINSFEHIASDGAFANHAKFRINITGRQAKAIDGITNVNHRVIESSGPEGTRKTTIFQVVGTNHITYSRSLVPTGGDVTGFTFDDDLTNLVTIATFREHPKNSALRGAGGATDNTSQYFNMTEVVQISEGLRVNNWVRIMQNGPRRIKQSLGPCRVTVNGSVRAYSKGLLTDPFQLPPGLLKDDVDSLTVSEPYVVEWGKINDPILWEITWSVSASLSFTPKPGTIQGRNFAQEVFFDPLKGAKR